MLPEISMNLGRLGQIFVADLLKKRKYSYDSFHQTGFESGQPRRFRMQHPAATCFGDRFEIRAA